MTDPTHPIASTLSEVLAALGWSCEHLARRLNAYAAASSLPDRVHIKTPYKWVNGAHPAAPWPTLVAALATEELGRPIAPADLGWRGDQTLFVAANADLALPWTGDGSLRALRTIAQAGPMDRRALLLLMGTAATAPAHDWLIAPAADDLGRSSGAPLPAEIVEDVDHITARLRRMDDRLGGGPLLALVSGQLRYVTSLIESRRYGESVGRRLHGSAAELLRLGGWLAFDSGQHALAQRQWIAALHAAHAAGDRAIGANILGFMSCQAKDLGQVQQAITLAETARTGYPGATPKVVAILHLRAAEAYANDSSPASCRRAIDAAFEALSGAPSSTGSPDWCYWLDRSYLGV